MTRPLPIFAADKIAALNAEYDARLSVILAEANDAGWTPEVPVAEVVEAVAEAVVEPIVEPVVEEVVEPMDAVVNPS